MPISLDDIVEETRHLPPDVVSELIDRILSAHHGAAEEISSAWKTELHQRVAEISSGEVTGIPLDQALARARKLVGL